MSVQRPLVGRPEELHPDTLHAVATATGLPMAYLRWPGGRCVWATASYAHWLRLPLAELVGREPQNYLPGPAWDSWQCALQQLACEPVHGASLHTHLALEDGVPVAVHLVAHADASGKLLGVVVMATDALPHSQALRMVQASDTRMRKFALATSESLIFFRDGMVLDANPAAIALTGMPLSQLQRTPVLHLLPLPLRAQAEALLTHGSAQPLETQLLHRTGPAVDVEMVVTLMPDDDTGYGLVVLRDITARKRAEADMQFLAFHDPLTRLPNRQGLMRSLRQALQQAQSAGHRVALLYVDLDRFKDVNDSLGHDAGDQLLIDAARRLCSKVHPDDVVARLGGDEFVVVLTSAMTASQAPCILKDIRHVLGQPYQSGGGQVSVPASIGICNFPEDGATAEELMLNASAAMETAKGQGQGHHQFYGMHMAERTSRLLAQDQMLRDAVEKNLGLVLHYQPQWNLHTNRAEGFEALVRWHHPERGLLPPSEFIAFAEERGLISMLDRWVIHAACRQMRAWRDAGLPPLPVAVNMSAIEFAQTDLVEEVRCVLAETGMEAQWLEIELTETTLMKHSGRVLETLQALRALGVRLSIDDFGTGYSSLAYLKRYPLDKIKIDRSFIKDTPHDAEDVSLVRAIIEMAHSLHLRTVAEGVENAAQWQLLQGMGCDLVQGYHLSRPMPANEALAWQQQHGRMGLVR